MTKVLMLYDEITPTLAKEFVSQMSKLQPTEPITIAINSPGGSVPAGDAIALAIDRHRGPTTARIDALAASAASFVAMFCDRTILAASSFLMVHCPFATMVGTADDLTSAAGLLREIENRYAATYSCRSGLPLADILAMMRKETWLSAADAVRLNFADEIDTSLIAAKTVAKAVLRYKHVPQEIRAMAGVRPKFDAEQDRRQRQRRRMAIIAAQSQRFRQQDAADAELGALVRRRRELAAVVQHVRADEARRDLEERAAAARRLKADYYYDRSNTPREQRRYD